MFQMGGHYWDEFYPPMAKTLLASQASDGSWSREAYPHGEDGIFGKALTTSWSVMALCVPYQLLPVYQR